MTEMKSIDIDFYIHKHIEQERRSFSETPNEVLHRLLKINDVVQAPAAPILNNQKRRIWSSNGVTLPHGTLARFTYNKRLHEAIIDNGEWKTNNGKHASPSGAAISVARTKAGKQTNLDGWTLWEVKRPEDKEWKKLDSLRFRNILS